MFAAVGQQIFEPSGHVSAAMALCVEAMRHTEGATAWQRQWVIACNKLWACFRQVKSAFGQQEVHPDSHASGVAPEQHLLPTKAAAGQ